MIFSNSPELFAEKFFDIRINFIISVERIMKRYCNSSYT